MRKKKHPEHVNHERWLVSYADFITLLFAFFTTLYAISTVDQKKAGKLQYSMMTAFNVEFFETASAAASGGAASKMFTPIYSHSESGGPERGRGGIESLANDLQSLVGRGDTGMAVTLRHDGVVVSLAEAMFFASGSAELRAESQGAMRSLLDVLKAYEGTMDLVIEGHTDDVPVRGGRYASNWDLSVARATTVLQVFVEAHHFDPAHLSAAGHAEYRPAATNETPEGRARNRRVDLVIKPRVAPPDGSTVARRTP